MFTCVYFSLVLSNEDGFGSIYPVYCIAQTTVVNRRLVYTCSVVLYPAVQIIVRRDCTCIPN